MKKRIFKPMWLVAVLLIFCGSVFAQGNFTVTIPASDPYNKLCKPLKAGDSLNLNVNVRCNIPGPFTLSINKASSFGTEQNWIDFDNNAQTINQNETVTFGLTISPPSGMPEYTHTFNLYFYANKDGYNYNFNQNQFIVIIDNTTPALPEVRVEYKTSTTLRIFFYSSDARSAQYTQANQSSGVNGIRSYLLVLKNPDGSVKATKTYNATETNNYHTFSSLSSNTNYTTFVTAEDLATNTKANAGLQVLMPPATPSNITASSPGFCSITLTWNAPAGATNYKVCNTTTDPTKVYTTTATSYTFTGLEAETSYGFWVKAIGSGGESDVSNKTATTREIPPITGSSNVCTSNTKFYLNNLPKGWSVSWSKSSNLTYVSGQNTTSYTVIAANPNISEAGWVQANVNGSCGPFPVIKSFWVGKPTYNIDSEEMLEVRMPGIAIIDNSDFDPYSIQGVYQIDWSYTGPLTNFAGNLYKATFKAGNSAGQGFIYAKAYNTCGTFEKQFFYQVVNPLKMSISPNPTSNQIDVEVTDNDAQENNVNNPEYNVTIVNMYGNVEHKEKHKGSSFKINVSNLSKGLHSISLERNGNYCSETFIKE